MKNIALLTFCWLTLCTGYAQAPFSSYEIAQTHPIIAEGPAPDFFEGALIGNGGLGAVVCTRPDAIVIRFGHNNVWDIRIAEDNREKIGTFQEVFEKVEKIDPALKSLNEDPWYKEYLVMCRENYAKPYPRPFPCGSLILGFDRRKVEVIESKLDISHGLVTIKLLLDQNKSADLLVFADMNKDRVWMKLVDENGTNLDNCFNRIRLLPDKVTPSDFPNYTTQFMDRAMTFRQVMPFQEPAEYDKEKGHPDDESFCLSVVTGPVLKTKKVSDSNPNLARRLNLEHNFKEKQPFWACVALDEGLSSSTKPDLNELMDLTTEDYGSAYTSAIGIWKDYWEKSGVLLEDKFLEEVWYRNLYFFNSATKSGVNCPGLFANWSFGDIGTAWHGDYHMNYNTQQPFWVTFSSNHLEKNLPYVELIEFLSEVSKITAKDYYGMRGAFYPHSAYPVKMTMSPYPVPTWGWEVFETPWAVQGVWWHYLYSGDLEFLRTRAFPLMKDAVLFLVDYMTRPEAHGKQWNDNKYHVFPTVPPELYGLMPGFRFNNDCIVDLTLIKFLFNSYLKSVELLEIQKQEKETLRDVQKILANYPDYPTAESEEYGEVFVSVLGESTETVYNVPNNLITAFPGEDHGLHSDEEIMELLSNTKNNSQIRGANELVFQHMQAARIGMLDLEVFKREIKYNLMPNGTCTDNFLHVSDNGTHDRYARTGIWFENFALPAVINECMMQSYNGIIRLFPNWPEHKQGQFRTLRAAGGFLVSSSFENGSVEAFNVKSENGGILKFYNPWDAEVSLVSNGKRRDVTGEIIELHMSPGESLDIQPYAFTGDKPKIEKLGTIAIDLVEATPFVFKNKVYRLEWVRPNTKHNASEISYLHIVNHKTGEEISNFGERYRFPCAYVENDTVYVVGTYENLGWHGTLLTLFKSTDLKTWTNDTIYDAPEELHQICNTSLCKTDEGYALMFEISGTPEAGVGFTPRFLTSKDLKTFHLTPKACTYGRDRYSAPHCLRFYNGWFYSFYLEANKPTGYEQYLLRSEDLVHWESSPYNPVLSASKEDKYIARKHFTEEELEIIAGAEDSNNSDIDFCEYKGKLIITYSWGNQRSQESLAEALYDGSMGQFLEGWFP